MIYVGLDIGTTASKATAINSDGKVLATSSGEYGTIRTHDGHAEIDPRAVWQTVKTIISEVAASVGKPIKAIAIASLGESFVALDKNDNVLCNSMLYSDIRGTEEIKDIRVKVSEQALFKITGMPINSMYTLNKLLWTQKHSLAIFDKADKIFLFGDFIGYMLSGERLIDYSLASRTMLFDFTDKGWSKYICDLFGLNSSKFSKPIPIGSILGRVSEKIADELGLSKDILLVAGAHDQVCAALGAGILQRGECVDGIGTSECITTIIDGSIDKEYMRSNNLCIEPYAFNGEHVTLAFNVTGVALLRWFCDTFEQGFSQSKALGLSVFEYLERSCPYSPTSLYVLPHFAGSGTPYMDPYASGAILGLKLSTTKGDIYKACMEGLCFEMLFNAKLLSNMGTRLTSMTCVGGGSQSSMLLQIKADIMGVPVKRLATRESGTLGLAMLSATACGDFKSLTEAADKLVIIDKEFYPNKEANGVYAEKYKTYKRLYPNILNIRDGKWREYGDE